MNDFILQGLPVIINAAIITVVAYLIIRKIKRNLDISENCAAQTNKTLSQLQETIKQLEKQNAMMQESLQELNKKK